jgi:spoIIIJ-associated protein
MDWIEVTARTVEDAKELALDRLGVVEDELEFEVLDEPRGGLFRRSEARIRARVKPLSREKPADRRRRRPRSERQGPRSSSGGRGRTPAAAVADDDDDPAGNAPANGAGTDRQRSRRRRGRGGGGGSAAPDVSRGGNSGSRGSGEGRSRGPAPRTKTRVDEDQEAEVDVETMPVEEQAAHAAEFAGELVRAMGFEGTVRTEIGDDDVTVRIEGENLGVLVGPRGVTLHALEEVVRAAVQHHAGGRSARLHVDVSGYRERRREALAAFATKVAHEVKEAGTARSLEPMASPDRKVVHDVVAEIEGVSTVSEGEDPRRRVVIRPE